MKIIERYILKEFIASVFYCIAVFIFLYVMADLFNYLDEMMKNQVSLNSILTYYLNSTPSIFVQVTPVAVLLSTAYVLSNLNRNNEITALRASGVSLWSIIRPILVAGFLLSLLVFIVNDKIVPPSFEVSNKIRQEEIRDVKKDGQKEKILENVALYGSDNRMIYAKYFDPRKNTLKEIIILEHDKDQNIKSKSSAEEARWRNNKWVFRDFYTYSLDKKGDIIGTSIDEEKTIGLKETPEDFKKLKWRTEYMNFAELREYISRFSGSGIKTIKVLSVDLHYKISFAFVSLIVIVVAAPLSLVVKRGGGLLIGIGISIAVVLTYYAVSSICLALGKAGFFPPFIAAWMANFIFLGLGIYLMRKRK